MKDLEVIREMKTYKNIFEKVIEPDNIRMAIINASKGKRKRRDVKDIYENQDYHIEIIRSMLIEGTYVPAFNAECIINEGTYRKERQIRKPNFKYDQVIHHAIIQQLMPMFLKGMYEYSVACVPGRGFHYGKKYIEKWLREDIKHTKYVCKMDIRHFYATIDHEILKNRLRKNLRDEKLLDLLNVIIDSCEPGLPLGYYPSPWLSNFLLQDMDHFIKEQLRVKHYMRQVDDMVLFGNNKRMLHRNREAIEKYLKEELHLEMKDNWQVFRFDYVDKKTGKRKGRPLDYMGFVFYRDRTVMRRGIMLRATRKARKLGKKQRITWHDASSMLSYMGWVSHTDTYGMYLKHIKPYVDVKQLKNIVSKHQRRLNREANKMENGRGLCVKEAGSGGHDIQSQNGIS